MHDAARLCGIRQTQAARGRTLHPMNHDDQMAALRARLARAEAERDTWRSTRMQENYLEAYSRVEALSLELMHMHQAGMRALAGAGAMPISEPVDDEDR